MISFGISELLASRLREYNMLKNCVKITNYRVRHECFADIYHMSEFLCFCIVVYSLFKRLMILYEPDQWGVFIDSSSRSLKAVLLHNGTSFLPFQ